MKNFEVAFLLAEIANLMEIKGENAFKVRAFRQGARALETLERDVTEYVREGKLTDIPGIGKGLAEVITEYCATGRSSFREELARDIPPGLVELTAVPGLGPRSAHTIFRELGVKDLDELEAAAKAKKIRTLPGLGVKQEKAILQGIKLLRSGAGQAILGLALPLAERYQELLGKHPLVQQVDVVGSVRRKCAVVEDIDLLAASNHPEKVRQYFARLPGFRFGVEQTGDQVSAVHDLGVRVNCLIVPPEHFPVARFYATGSRAHLAKLQAAAEEKGFSLRGLGLFRDGRLVASDENGIYKALGLPIIPPELREGQGEVEAAQRGALPELITEQDIRGDLHCHTNWSDGVHSIPEMAAEAKKRGYEYLAVTDHSRSLAVARGLTVERLAKQHAYIRQLNEQDSGFYILTGVEVDILSDGRLDYPDEILREMDVVVASIHSGFRQDKERLTTRVELAMKNENVDILGHPTGRLLNRRDPYEIDMERVFAVAEKTGTVLEINSSPDRLDLKAEHAREAKERGIKVAINTDAHDRSRMAEMSFGVANGRRGWLTAGDVINTLPYDQLVRFLRE